MRKLVKGLLIFGAGAAVGAVAAASIIREINDKRDEDNWDDDDLDDDYYDDDDLDYSDLGLDDIDDDKAAVSPQKEEEIKKSVQSPSAKLTDDDIFGLNEEELKEFDKEGVTPDDNSVKNDSFKDEKVNEDKSSKKDKKAN